MTKLRAFMCSLKKCSDKKIRPYRTIAPSQYKGIDELEPRDKQVFASVD